MKNEYKISIYLDTRREKKKTGLFPVKLRVYHTITQKKKLYPTSIEMSEEEFENTWNKSKPKKQYQEKRRNLLIVENHANTLAEKLSPFTFELFERNLYRKASDSNNVNSHFEEAIKKYKRYNQIGTADTYALSKKSFVKFCTETKKPSFEKITFQEISPEWLKDYEHFMTETLKRSLSTVSIYVRCLRAIFNNAIEMNDIERGYYPFSKRKYQVPSVKNVKKALSPNQLKTLYNFKPKIKEQEKAKDFWFLSYSFNGINVKDIALLKFEDIKKDKIEIYRAKTKRTSKGELSKLVIYLNDYSKQIIDKYKKKSKNKNDYVFEIINETQSKEEQQKRIKNFTRFINQHLKKVAKEIGLPEEISTNWARHSFATNSIRKGASMEFMQESLGHGNIKTTQGYFSGFDNDTKKEFSQSLMDF